MLFIRCLGLLLLANVGMFAQECCEQACCEEQEECEQEESCCRGRCRPRYNPEEEELYRQRTEVLYPSHREGMLETMTHQ